MQGKAVQAWPRLESARFQNSIVKKDDGGFNLNHILVISEPAPVQQGEHAGRGKAVQVDSPIRLTLGC